MRESLLAVVRGVQRIESIKLYAFKVEKKKQTFDNNSNSAFDGCLYVSVCDRDTFSLLFFRFDFYEYFFLFLICSFMLIRSQQVDDSARVGVYSMSKCSASRWQIVNSCECVETHWHTTEKILYDLI